MRVDVLIRGVGPAAVLLARSLREAGVESALQAPDPLTAPEPAGGGVVLPITPEHPHRLVAALGVGRARELVSFGLAGAARLGGGTGLEVELLGDEARERDAALIAADQLGLRAEPTDAGYRLGDGGWVEPPRPTAVAAGDIQAEMTIHAPAWRTEDPWLADKLWPVRQTLSRYAGPSLARPVFSRHFHVAWFGGLACQGARFATPHLELGETEPVASARVAALQDRFTAERFPGAGPALSREAWIFAESCDGLPILGPIPGRPTELVCAGFGAFGLAWMAEAAAQVAALVLLGRAEIPGVLSSWRFL